MTGDLVDLVDWRWTDGEHCERAGLDLRAARILDDVGNDANRIGKLLNLKKLALGIDFDTDFRLAPARPRCNGRRRALDSSLVCTECCMTTLCANFALAHTQIVADNQHHFVLGGHQTRLTGSRCRCDCFIVLLVVTVIVIVIVFTIN